MVTFERTGGNEFHVLVNDKKFGVIDPERSIFYLGTTTIQDHIEISPTDLETIATKIRTEFANSQTIVRGAYNFARRVQGETK